jgi:hypothetical protein
VALNGSILREVSDHTLEIHLSKKKKGGIITVIDQAFKWQAAMPLFFIIN